MSVPANVTADLAKLDTDIAQQEQNLSVKAQTAAALTAAQTADTNAASAITALAGTISTDQTTLAADVAAWIASLNPPAHLLAKIRAPRIPLPGLLTILQDLLATVTDPATQAELAATIALIQRLLSVLSKVPA